MKLHRSVREGFPLLIVWLALCALAFALISVAERFERMREEDYRNGYQHGRKDAKQTEEAK